VKWQSGRRKGDKNRNLKTGNRQGKGEREIKKRSVDK